MTLLLAAGGVGGKVLVELLPVPVANADNFAAIVSGDDVTLDVAANDTFSGAKGDLTFEIDDALTEGTVVDEEDGTLTYTPPDEAGNDTFAYRITDSTTQTSAYATVTVNVQAAPGDAYGALAASVGTLVYHHRFNELAGSSTLTDASGNGITGTYNGTPEFGAASIIEMTGDNRAVNFNGASDALVDYDASMARSTFTITCGMTPSAGDIANGLWIMSRGGENTASNVIAVRFSHYTPGSIRAFARIEDSPYSFRVVDGGSAMAGERLWWSLVADASGMSLYVNGEFIGTMDQTTGTVGNTSDLTYAINEVGQRSSSTIDECMMHEEALSLSEIRQLHEYEEPVDPEEPLPGDDHIYPRAASSSVTVSTKANLESAVNSAPAGRNILLAPGNYAGFDVTASGSQANPICLMPADPANPPVITGTAHFRGVGLQSWGLIYRNHSGTPSGGTRSIILWGPDMGLYYNDIEPAGIGIEIRNGSVKRTQIMRNYFYNQPTSASQVLGADIIKAGASNTQNIDIAALIQNNYFVGCTLERETISIKAMNVTFRRNHMTGCRQVATRHAWACLIEENRIVAPYNEGSDSGRIQISGVDHIVRGNIGITIDVSRGNYDGDTVVNGNVSPSPYLSAKRVILQNNVMSTRIGVGDNVFSFSQPYPVVDITGSNNSPSYTLYYGATVGTAATVSSNTPPTFTPAVVGTSAYDSIITA